MTIESSCKKFMNKIGAQYKNGGWRMHIDGSCGLTRDEQETNRKGGWFIGKNAITAAAVLAGKGEWEAKDLFDQAGLIPMLTNDGDVSLEIRKKWEDAASDIFNSHQENAKKMIKNWDDYGIAIF